MVTNSENLPRRKWASCNQIGGKISLWLVLFIGMTCVALALLFQDYRHHPELVFIDDMVKYDQADISGFINDESDCFSSQDLWQQYYSQLINLPPDQQPAFIQDIIFRQQHKDCDISSDYLRAVTIYWHKNNLDVSQLPRLEIIGEDVEYEKKYRLFLDDKKRLEQQVEELLLPGESFDQGYARQLNQLYEEIFIEQ